MFVKFFYNLFKLAKATIIQNFNIYTHFAQCQRAEVLCKFSIFLNSTTDQEKIHCRRERDAGVASTPLIDPNAIQSPSLFYFD